MKNTKEINSFRENNSQNTFTLLRKSTKKVIEKAINDTLTALYTTKQTIICAAKLIDYFWNWTIYQAKRTSQYRYVIKSINQIRIELQESHSKGVVQQAINLLMDLGYLKRVKNSRNGQDRTYRYLLRTELLEDDYEKYISPELQKNEEADINKNECNTSKDIDITPRSIDLAKTGTGYPDSDFHCPDSDNIIDRSLKEKVYIYKEEEKKTNVLQDPWEEEVTQESSAKTTIGESDEISKAVKAKNSGKESVKTSIEEIKKRANNYTNDKKQNLQKKPITCIKDKCSEISTKSNNRSNEQWNNASRKIVDNKVVEVQRIYASDAVVEPHKTCDQEEERDWTYVWEEEPYRPIREFWNWRIRKYKNCGVEALKEDTRAKVYTEFYRNIKRTTHALFTEYLEEQNHISGNWENCIEADFPVTINSYIVEKAIPKPTEEEKEKMYQRRFDVLSKANPDKIKIALPNPAPTVSSQTLSLTEYRQLNKGGSEVLPQLPNGEHLENVEVQSEKILLPVNVIAYSDKPTQRAIDIWCNKLSKVSVDPVSGIKTRIKNNHISPNDSRALRSFVHRFNKYIEINDDRTLILWKKDIEET